MTAHRKTYEINWSYPSSPNAVRFGHAKSGCYTVSYTVGPYYAPTPVQGFEFLTQATLFMQAQQAGGEIN